MEVGDAGRMLLSLRLDEWLLLRDGQVINVAVAVALFAHDQFIFGVVIAVLRRGV